MFLFTVRYMLPTPFLTHWSFNSFSILDVIPIPRSPFSTYSLDTNILSPSMRYAAKATSL